MDEPTEVQLSGDVNIDDVLDAPALETDDGETDLDYLSRPENYTGGANFQTMQRLVAPKETKVETNEDDEANKLTPDQKFLYMRYREIFPTDDELIEMKKEKSLSEGSEADGDSSWVAELKIEVDQPEVTADESPDWDRRDGSPNSRTSSRGPTFALCSGTDNSYASGGPRLSLTPGMLDGSPSMMSQMGKRGPRGSRSRIGVGKEVKGRLAKERFQNAVRLVSMVIKWATTIIKKDKLTDDGTSAFTTLVKEYSYENLKNSGLHFDPNYFKAKVEINLSTEVKYILSLPSEQRTPEQIQTAMYGLRSLRSFAEYPLHMQEKLCKVAWFAMVSPKRQIIRQGHLAENFYFILSGQAVVTILVKDPKTGESVTRTATIMRRGMSFGELALLHHSRRTATVTTQENVQLLTIGRDDFFDIFMSSTGPDQLPDHVKFVGQLEFMKQWPIAKLLEHPEQCLLHFFKRSAVIVKDSLDSDWLYIVKSGSCQVIKTLKGVTPKLGLRTGDHLEDHLKLPKLGTGEQGPRIDTGLRRRRPPKKIFHSVLHKAVAQFDDIFKKIRRPPPIESKPDAEPESAEDDTFEEQPTTRPTVRKFDKFRLDAATYSKKRIDDPQERLKERNSYRPRRRKKPKALIVLPIKINMPAKLPPPVFVQVESLNPRDVFGLETVQFDNEFGSPRTTVSLVSRGAECIMLSKEFFAKNANEAVRQTLRKLTRPYPEEDTFQENLQTKEDWNLYKATLIEDIVHLQQDKKRLHIPQYA